jgi:Trk-type K+ transport system membrane component
MGSEQRGQLRDPDKLSRFTTFAVRTSRRVFALYTRLIIYAVHEIVSAYGTVGLSLGVPTVESPYHSRAQ